VAPGAPRELLDIVVAVACRAQRTMARLLLGRLCGDGCDGEPEVRRADFLTAFALLEEAAERSGGRTSRPKSRCYANHADMLVVGAGRVS